MTDSRTRAIHAFRGVAAARRRALEAAREHAIEEDRQLRIEGIAVAVPTALEEADAELHGAVEAHDLADRSLLLAEGGPR